MMQGKLVMEREKADFFEAVMAANGIPAKPAANWVLGDYSAALKEQDAQWGAGKVDASALAALIQFVLDDTISNRAAKDVLALMWETGKSAETLIDEQGLRQVSDTGAIEAMIDEIIAANPDQVAKAKENPKLVGWFVGQVMKASGGKANPGLVNKLLAAKLA